MSYVIRDDGDRRYGYYILVGNFAACYAYRQEGSGLQDGRMPKGTKIPKEAVRFASKDEALEYIEEHHVHGQPVVVRVKPRGLKKIARLTEKNLGIALRRLGKTEREVAANLLRWGCFSTYSGGSRISETCPVSTYLQKVFGLSSTQTTSCTINIDCRLDGKLIRTYEVPEPVEDFIQNFDDGYHPELKKAG